MRRAEVLLRMARVGILASLLVVVAVALAAFVLGIDMHIFGFSLRL
jgi:hypothetical protein